LALDAAERTLAMPDRKESTKVDRRRKSSKTVEPEQRKKKQEQKPVLRQSHLHELVVIKKHQQ
jgi:hypothetical protein